MVPLRVIGSSWLLVVVACAPSPSTVTPEPSPVGDAPSETEPAEVAVEPAEVTAASETAPTTTAVTLYFTDVKGVQTRGCDEVRAVTREVTATADALPTAVVRALLRGPTSAERADGMGNPFEPDPHRVPDATDGLAASLRGVRVEGGVALVDFSAAARVYLTDGPACVRETVLTPIQRTLESLPMVHGVQLLIEGTPMEEGGA